MAIGHSTTFFSLVFFAFAAASPYSKALREVENWGVIPRGLIADAKLHLEDLYFDSVELPANVRYLKNIRLGLAFANVTEDAEADEVYERAVGNLKAVAPQLKRVGVYGGYAYFPENGTAQQLRDEIVFLKEHLDRVARVLHENRLEIESGSTFDVNLVFDRSVVFESDVVEMLDGMLERNETVMRVDECSAVVDFKMDDIQVHVSFNFADKLSPFIRDEYPAGRSFRTQVAAATARGRLSARIAGALLSVFVGSQTELFECRI